jgi:radical SAM/Cys-rich protein
MHATLPRLEVSDFPAIRRRRLDTLQVNLGYKCNQSCLHCHVNAGPTRTETMDRRTISEVIAFLKASRVAQLDLTGGAPELNPHFRQLVLAARNLGVHVMDRCNLTILQQPGQQDLPEFLAANRVEVVASLPCYLEENVDAQRGKGVFEASIRALQMLNVIGYGRPESGLMLNLVYNPQGATLPPAQDGLELDYRRFLGEHYGVRFNRLFVLTNMPIQRFGSMLITKGQFDNYMNILKIAPRTWMASCAAIC